MPTLVNRCSKLSAMSIISYRTKSVQYLAMKSGRLLFALEGKIGLTKYLDDIMLDSSGKKCTILNVSATFPQCALACQAIMTGPRHTCSLCTMLPDTICAAVKQQPLVSYLKQGV